MLRKGACLLALGLAMAMPAQAAPAGSRRAEELLAAGAHRQAALDLVRQIPGLRGAERDRAYFRLGLAHRRAGDVAEAERAFERVGPQSAWFPRAAGELADLFALQGKNQRAIRALRSLLRALPEREALPVRLRLGDELLAARDYEGAINAYRPLHDCDDAALREAAWYGAGWAATRAGLHARALWFWHQALREFPDSPRIKEARLNLGNHYLRMGKLAFAADQLRAVGSNPAERDPESVAFTAEFVAAEAAVTAGDWVRAIRHYQAAGGSPRWMEPSAYGVGFALWQAGRLAEAEDAFLTCLARFPRGRFRAAARYMLGRVQDDRGRASDATETYKAVVATSRSRWAEEALFQLAAQALAAGRPAEAIAWGKRLIADYPTGRMATPGLWLLAEAQLASGAVSDAIASYGRLASKPESLSFLEGKGDRVLFKLGLAYFKAGDLPSADAAFRQVRREAGPLEAEALFWRGETLYRQGHHGEAAAQYERVLSAHGDSAKAPEAAYGLGWAELRRGRRGPAMWAFKQAAERLLDRDLKRDAYHRLALLLLDAGSYREAQVALKQVARLDEGGDPTETAFYLAWSQMRAGDLAEAADGFRRVADRVSASSRGRQARTYQGQILLRLGRFADAGQAFETLAGLGTPGASPDEVDPRIRAAAAYLSGGDGARAAALYARVGDDASASAEVRRGTLQPLASAYLQAEMLPQAESVLTGAASADAWAPPFLTKVAEGYARAGKWREAAAAYAAVPNPDAETQLERARALRKGGDPAGAAEIYERLSDRPGGLEVATVLFELFEAYDEAGRPEAGRFVLDRLEKVPGVDAQRLALAFHRQGETMQKRGDIVAAITAFRSAERKAKKPSVAAWRARYALGAALAEAKRYEDALFELTQLTAAKEPASPKEPLTSFRTWKALASLKQGEALERLRRWDEAKSVYEFVANDAKAPERERQEAHARLAWIKANVKRAQP